MTLKDNKIRSNEFREEVHCIEIRAWIPELDYLDSNSDFTCARFDSTYTQILAPLFTSCLTFGI